MALRTACGSVSPSARWEAIAEESVQPVPCVFGLSIRGLVNQVAVPSGSTSTSLASLMPCPPLTSTAQPKCSASVRPAVSISASVRMPSLSSRADSVSSSDVRSCMACASSASVSGMFGVMTVASGNSRVVSAATASSSMSLAPEVATITGSSTMFRA